jgi:tyrosinase
LDLFTRVGAALGTNQPVTVDDLLDFSRRDFLKLSALGAVGLALASCTQEQLEKILDKIKNRPVRRNINTMTDDDPDLVSYRAAVAAMKNLPSSDLRNWTRQAQIHDEFCPHGNWLFLPWHRAYMWYFEEICRQLSGNDNFALPYWNWQNDKKIPAAFWGGASNPLFNGTRFATDTSTITSPVFAPSYIENPVLVETNFEAFASGAISAGTPQQNGSAGGQGPLESGPHNSTHNFVGGDMASFVSPLDPIFWAHHNIIDAIWVEWNIKRNNPNTNNADWNRTFTEFCDRNGNPVTINCLTTTLFPLFNYRFDDPVLGV